MCVGCHSAWHSAEPQSITKQLRLHRSQAKCLLYSFPTWKHTKEGILEGISSQLTKLREDKATTIRIIQCIDSQSEVFCLQGSLGNVQRRVLVDSIEKKLLGSSAEARDAANYPRTHRTAPHNEELSDQSVDSAKLEKSWPRCSYISVRSLCSPTFKDSMQTGSGC